MGFSSIPNQPILFEDPIFAGQSCLNNDTRAYAQLLQAGDTMCIQLKNQASSALYNYPPLTNDGTILVNGDFSADLSTWHQGVVAAISDLGPWPWTPFYWYYNNSGAQATSLGFGDPLYGIGKNVPTITLGNYMLISLYFETYQSLGGIDIQIGDFLGSSWNGVTVSGSASLNFDNRYTVILSANVGNDFWISPTTLGTKPFLQDIKIYDCTPYLIFLPDSPFLAGWMYVESCDGYQVMAANHTMTSNISLLTGYNYSIKFKVKNLTAGAFNIFDADGNLIVSATENRQYEVYVPYTGTTGPITIEVNNNNSVGGIIYDFEFDTQCFDHRIKLVNPSTSEQSAWFDKLSGTYPIRYYQDRILWCFDMGNINDSTSGNPLSTGCYNVVIDDCGNGEITSYTTINYTTGTHDCSVWIEANNEGYAFDFFFNASDTSDTFTLGQRLRLLQFNPIYPIKSEEYLYSNGNMVRTFAQTSKKREAWFDYCDEPTHDVIRLQLLSDTLTIDNKDYYFVGADYQPEWSQNGKYNLAQSRVELMAVEEKTLFNKSCQ